MTWQFLGMYVFLFVTSAPFMVAGGLGLSVGVGAGWWLGSRRR